MPNNSGVGIFKCSLPGVTLSFNHDAACCLSVGGEAEMGKGGCSMED